ncbi:MAG: hypothetical protein OEN55_13200 [Alphaproteobacteria bacterium]|nr:hypothetical protein [Alphaproteobacteria bacterium]
MKRLALAFSLTFLAAPGWAAGAVASEDTLYSIQVRAVPMTEKADGMATYRALRDKGYLTYTYKAEIDGKPWLRVAVGVFDGIDDAAVFGESFSAKEKQDHFVAVAPVRVVAGDGGDFVVTPSALWTRAGGKAREVLAFDDPAPRGFAAPGGIRLKPSPDRKAVAFQYGARVYAVGLGDEKANLLTGDRDGFSDEHKYGPTPYWSPSGRYVAFHDTVGPEFSTNLWVARADGSELRSLVDNWVERRKAVNEYVSIRAVWEFIWHPSEDRIFFVHGYADSTIHVGGPIRSVDMAGNVRTMLDSDVLVGYWELAGPLRIEDGYLHYRKVQYGDNYISRTYTDKRTPLSDL